MDVREEYVMQKVNRKEKSICPNCIHHNLCIAENNQPCFECNRFIDAHDVTVQELALPEHDYYVLRNTETGMYFRGKGVNRWGKNFNQATIYRVKGTAEHSIKEVAWHGEKAELVRIKIVEMPQPPKGE